MVEETIRVLQWEIDHARNCIAAGLPQIAERSLRRMSDILDDEDQRREDAERLEREGQA